MTTPLLATQLITIPLLATQLITIPLLATQLITIPLLATQLMTTPLLATQLMTIPLLASVTANKPAVIHETRVQNQATVYRIQTQYWNSGTLLTQSNGYMLQDNICNTKS